MTRSLPLGARRTRCCCSLAGQAGPGAARAVPEKALQSSGQDVPVSGEWAVRLLSQLPRAPPVLILGLVQRWRSCVAGPRSPVIHAPMFLPFVAQDQV